MANLDCSTKTPKNVKKSESGSIFEPVYTPTPEQYQAEAAQLALEARLSSLLAKVAKVRADLARLGVEA